MLELPVTAALQSAEGFAAGGVRILSALGCGYLSFGCESGSGEALFRAAKASCAPEFEAFLHEAMQELSLIHISKWQGQVEYHLIN